MKANSAAAVLANIVLGSACLGEPVPEPTTERVIALKHTAAAADIEVLGTVVRSIGDIKYVSADTMKRTVTFRGTADQIALAEWLVAELDRPAVLGSGVPASRQFRTAGTDGPITRVFYMRHATAVEDLQEAATTIRSLAEIRRAFVYKPAGALVLRGTVQDTAFAEWLVDAVDQPAGTRRPATPVYRVSTSGDDVARVFYVASTASQIDIQETATVIRSIAEIRRLFVCRMPRAVAVRGTGDQIAAANWLLTALERPVKDRLEYAFPTGGDERLRVFWLTQADSALRFHEIVTSVRAKTGIRRAFGHGTRRALALRGTTDEVAAAEQAIRDAEKVPSTGGR